MNTIRPKAPQKTDAAARSSWAGQVRNTSRAVEMGLKTLDALIGSDGKAPGGLMGAVMHSVDDGVFKLSSADADTYRLRYRDGQASANDTCMIRLSNTLNPRIPPAYVNGRPHGFC